MVGGECPEAGREFRAASVAQLIGMQLDRQPKRPGALEQTRDLRRVERNPFAEGVHGIGKTRLDHPWHQFATDERQVIVRPSRELRGHRVRRQERGPHGQPRGAAEPARHFQHPDLGIAVQSVPGLDLDRGGSLLGHRLQPGERASVELFRGGRPGGAHRGHDPAAGGRQFFVARASEPRLELGAPISPEDEVGVAVDQRRGDPTSVKRPGLRRLVRRKVGTRPDPGDLPVPDRERPVFDHGVRVRCTGPHRRDARVGQQQVRGLHGPLRFAIGQTLVSPG